MPFTDDGGQPVATAWYAAVVTAVLPLVAAGCAWIGRWAERRKAEGRLDRDARVADLMGRVKDQRAEAEVVRDQLRQLEELVRRRSQEYADCREDQADLWGYCRLLHAAACRQSAALAKLGGPTEELPLPPERQPREPREPETEFLERSVAQGKKLVDELGKGAADAGSAGGTADPGGGR